MSLVIGNSVRALKDARENYPVWLDAISWATWFIHFEGYIIHDDEVGEQFGRGLLAQARDGVCVIYGWMGGFGKTSRGFWSDFALGASKCAAITRRAWGARWGGSAETPARC